MVSARLGGVDQNRKKHMEDTVTQDSSTHAAVGSAEVQPTEIKVWDRFVRVFHWSIVALFALAFVTADEIETLHQVAGYAILALVLARIIWGFIGSPHARFSSFLRRPTEVIAFLRATARFSAPRHIGHNPAGGLMVAALIAMLLTITTTGILQTLSAFENWGWLEDLHEVAVFATLGLIALHLIGVLIASLEHGENLVRAMFTGAKRPPEA